MWRRELPGETPAASPESHGPLPHLTMAANPTPTNDQELLARFSGLIAGCLQMEVELGLKQNTATVMQTALDHATQSLLEAGQAKADLSARRKEFRQIDREGELTLGRCRLRLAALFGPRFSTQWEAAGFSERSTQVPEALASRLALLSRLDGYFTQDPTKESTDMGATAALCAAAHNQVRTSHSAVRTAKSEVTRTAKAKRATLARVRMRMRSLIRELDLLMPPGDPRWKLFGLHIPAKPAQPQPVNDLNATPLGGGQILFTWPRAPHATRYRLQLRLPGSDDFVSIKTVRSLETTLTGLHPGSTIDARIIAANSRGETSPSPVVQVEVA
jgi:hypothetical protein